MSEPSPDRGLWYEEFQVGHTYTSVERRVDDADIRDFARISGDSNPIHLDDEVARKSVFRARVAQGVLVEAIATGLAWQIGIFEGTILAFAAIDRQFVAPVFPGDSIRVELEVIGLDPEPSRRRGRVFLRSTVRNQRGEVVVEGTWCPMMKRRRTTPQVRSGEAGE